MQKRTAGRSAPYGQACLACFKNKSKCVLRSDGNGCERCHRLKRSCHPADALRRKGDKQTSSDARIAQLEGTLSQLVSLLQTGNTHVGEITNVLSPPPQQPRPDAEIANPHHPPNPSTMIPTPPTLTCQDVTAEGTNISGNGNLGDASGRTPDDAAFGDEDDSMDNDAMSPPWWSKDSENSYTTNPFQLASPPPSTVSPSSDSTCLDAFRSHMLHQFPFVHLPTHLTIQQLQRNRPFLLRAIICVTSSSADDKRTRALELKHVFCEMAFLQQSSRETQPFQQTLDLLLGLLTYIAWGWDHVLSRRSLSRFMVVAVSLVGEMSQEKAAPEHTRTIGHLEPKGFEGWYGGTATGVELNDAQLCLERQRAILGCFVLGSAVSAYFSQIEAPRWTPQMEEALTAISNSSSAECPSDQALAFQVRLQLLVLRASQVRERCQLPDQPPVATLPGPALLYLKSLMGQLQDLRASIPPAFQQHFVLLAQTYYTELCLMETIHTPSIIQLSLPPTTCGPTRLSCFWQSALAIKSCTSTLLTLSPSDLLGVSFIQWAQLAQCIATLHHLSALNETGWDPVALRSLIDSPVLLTSIAEKLELASAVAGEQASDGVFAQLARGLRMYQSACHDKDGGNMLIQHEEAQAAAEADANTMVNNQLEGYFSNSTSWLDQFFSDFDEQTIPIIPTL